MRKFLFRLARIYWLIARPVTLGSRALVIRDGKVLLVRMSYVNGWYLPGGGVDRGESFYDAVMRELREECALEVTHPQLFGLYLTRKHGKIDHVAVYIVENFWPIPDHPPDPEITEMAFFDLKNLPSDTTPATRRRIAEYLGECAVSKDW